MQISTRENSTSFASRVVGLIAVLTVAITGCVPEEEGNNCIRIGVSCGTFANYHDYAGPYFEGVGTLSASDQVDHWEFGPPPFYGQNVVLPGGTGSRQVSLVLSPGTSLSVSACEFLVGPYLSTYVGISCPERAASDTIDCPGPDACTLPAVLTFNLTFASWQTDEVGLILSFRGSGTYAFRLSNS